MFIENTIRFKLSITEQPYKKKPDKDEFSKIRFIRQELTIDDFVGAIECGYGFTYVYDQKNFHIKYKTKENFRYTKVLAFDIDDTDCDFETALDACVFPPTIAYRTYSDGEDGKCSYRFIYVFKNYINSLNFNEIYTEVARTNHFKDLDERVYNQFYFGTDKEGTVVNYDAIYTLEDFNVGLASYKTHTDLIPSEDGTYFTFPDDYYEIKRLWTFDQDTKRRHIRRYTDEGRLSRRKQLFIDGQLFKRINGIESVETMYRILQNEMKIYYDNTTDPISDEELRDIARRVIQYPFKCKTCDKHPSFRINVPYWKSVMNVGNSTYKPITAINIIRKKIRLDLFKKIYDDSQSYAENMNKLKENNFKISRRTFYNYLKELK